LKGKCNLVVIILGEQRLFYLFMVKSIDKVKVKDKASDVDGTGCSVSGHK